MGWVKRVVKLDQQSAVRAQALQGFVTADQRARFGKNVSDAQIVLAIALQRGLAELEHVALATAVCALVVAVDGSDRRRIWFFASPAAALAALLDRAPDPVDDVWREVPAEGSVQIAIIERGQETWAMALESRILRKFRRGGGAWLAVPGTPRLVGSALFARWLRQWRGQAERR